jgi:hypothetical protein
MLVPTRTNLRDHCPVGWEARFGMVFAQGKESYRPRYSEKALTSKDVAQFGVWVKGVEAEVGGVKENGNDLKLEMSREKIYTIDPSAPIEEVLERQDIFSSLINKCCKGRVNFDNGTTCYIGIATRVHQGKLSVKAMANTGTSGKGHKTKATQAAVQEGVVGVQLLCFPVCNRTSSWGNGPEYFKVGPSSHLIKTGGVRGMKKVIYKNHGSPRARHGQRSRQLLFSH